MYVWLTEKWDDPYIDPYTEFVFSSESSARAEVESWTTRRVAWKPYPGRSVALYKLNGRDVVVGAIRKIEVRDV